MYGSIADSSNSIITTINLFELLYKSWKSVACKTIVDQVLGSLIASICQIYPGATTANCDICEAIDITEKRNIGRSLGTVFIILQRNY